jgi:hypothetical protein
MSLSYCEPAALPFCYVHPVSHSNTLGWLASTTIEQTINSQQKPDIAPRLLASNRLPVVIN